MRARSLHDFRLTICVILFLLLSQSLAAWAVPIGVTINLLDSPDSVINQLRLAPGGEAAGLGVGAVRTATTVDLIVHDTANTC